MRPNDIGGSRDFGPIDTGDDRVPFHHEWEARVFAINRILLARADYTLDEFRDAVERMDAAEYRNASYYERWLFAVERLLMRKRLLSDDV